MNSCAKLTILTPTYNREKLLQRLYKSLCEQTCQEFQWLVIDDGSTDLTQELMKELIEQNKINIDYKRKKNGGKHTALNYAHPYIKGKYVVIVDSDDLLTYDAVEIILKKWEKYDSDKTISGITFQRGNIHNGVTFDANIKGEYVSTFADETNRGMCGDHCETVRSKLFNDFLFPEYSDEHFIAEGAMWYSITKSYKVIYTDEIVYLAEYLEGGLTKSGRILHIRNPRGCMWHASIFLNRDFKLKVRIKNALLYICYGKFANIDKKTMLENVCEEKRLILMIWLAGWLLYRYWKVKYNIYE